MMFRPQQRSTERRLRRPNTMWRSISRLVPFFIFSFAIVVALLFLLAPSAVTLVRRELPSTTSETFKSRIVEHEEEEFFPSPSTFEPHCVEIIPPLSDREGHSTPHGDSKSFCLTSEICVSPRDDKSESIIEHGYDFKNGEKVTCRSTGPSLIGTVENRSLECDELQKSVHCAHGQYNASSWNSICPNVTYANDVTRRKIRNQKNVTHLDGIAIIVPPYPWLENIFHFSQALLSAIHLASNVAPLFNSSSEMIKARHISLIFRSLPPEASGYWHNGITQALINHRLSRPNNIHNVSVSITSTYEDDWFHIYSRNISDQPQRGRPFCAKSGILLGMRTNVYLPPFPLYSSNHLWPFLAKNSSLGGGITTHTLQFQVPVESVLFRAAVYEYANITTIMNTTNLLDNSSPCFYNCDLKLPRNVLLDLPPNVLGYSRRNTAPDPPPGEPVTVGPSRRFSDFDENWYVNMLKEECTISNAKFMTLQNLSDITFKDQMVLFHQIGYVVGIHGANLLNMIAMPAFGGMFEVSAVHVPCYADGSNSGLAFWSYKPMKVASIEDSLCADWDWFCHHSANWRRVLIDDEIDKDEIRKGVKHGLQYINEFRMAFQHLGGVPVVLNETTMHYVVDWSQSATGDVMTRWQN